MINSRRKFLKTVGAATLAAPFVTRNLRAASPNGKLRHASFGGNGQAWSDVNSFAGHPKFELVAVADVDSRNFAQVKARFPEARVYQDWRELLAKEADNLDSVNVSTPDHMHGSIGMAAAALGKHVYGQKPLTQNLRECRAITERVRDKKLMSQMGIQISSEFTERFAVEMVHTGVIGKVTAVHSMSNKQWGDMNPVPAKEDKVPEGLDWNIWLGVAKDRPFIEGYYHPGNWRKRRDFGTGTLGDMGCHIFSGWFRSLGLTSPVSVKSTGPQAGPDNWAVNGRVEYIFPKTEFTDGETVPVTWYDGSSRPPKEIADLVEGKVPGQGSIIIGTEGVVLAPHMETPSLYRGGMKQKDYKYPKLEPRNHYHEFIDRCLDGKDKPSANFDYAGPLTESVLLGCLASVFPNEDLKWDGAAMTFSNSEEATKLVQRDYRKGWEIAF
jgi:predicted dehydrogenase